MFAIYSGIDQCILATNVRDANAASPCIQEATENAVMQISMINRRNHLSGLEHQFEKLTTEERLIQRKEKPGPVSKRTGTWRDTILRRTGDLKDAIAHA